MRKYSAILLILLCASLVSGQTLGKSDDILKMKVFTVKVTKPIAGTSYWEGTNLHIRWKSNYTGAWKVGLFRDGTTKVADCTGSTQHSGTLHQMMYKIPTGVSTYPLRKFKVRVGTPNYKSKIVGWSPMFTIKVQQPKPKFKPPKGFLDSKTDWKMINPTITLIGTSGGEYRLKFSCLFLITGKNPSGQFYVWFNVGGLNDNAGKSFKVDEGVMEYECQSEELLLMGDYVAKWRIEPLYGLATWNPELTHRNNLAQVIFEIKYGGNIEIKEIRTYF